ncbi:MAG: pirin family protein [Thermoplasmata archaeon]
MGSAVRAIEAVQESRPTLEGAGVSLRRAFGQAEVPALDPFLLLDDFRSENPLEYAAGFPWHPHRGIETVTYMIDGRVEHEDSLGNRGTIGTGDVQWMTSGSGIIHQEMPVLSSRKRLGGFQLWVNLPAEAKMTDPAYREARSEDIPWAEPARGVRAKVIAGQLGATKRPVGELRVDPRFLDVTVEGGAEFHPDIPDGHTAFAYVLDGRASFDPEGRDVIDSENLVRFGRSGGSLSVHARAEGVRFLLVSGRPLGEPVAWWGPIVMNDRAEIERALAEFRDGTFVQRERSGRAVPMKAAPDDGNGPGPSSGDPPSSPGRSEP